MAAPDAGGYYPPSGPRPAKGGIRSQSRSGGQESWWAGRWLAALDRRSLAGRLARGRSYARRGQVLSISVEQGVVTAEVQGSRRRPYWVTVWVRALGAEEKARLVRGLAGRPAVAARLLAGHVPEEVEDIFREAGAALFPDDRTDLQTECSCPDWSNPCKHAAAVYLLLGEEFDRDPFLIFRLRGVEREEIVALAAGGQAGAGARPDDEPASEPVPDEPLPENPDIFWDGRPAAPAALPPVLPAAAALPRRLGPFPFWRGQEQFLPALDPLYRAASAAGVELVAGLAGGGGAPEPDPGHPDPEQPAG